jgi:hypothetical protein
MKNISSLKCTTAIPEQNSHSFAMCSDGISHIFLFFYEVSARFGATALPPFVNYKLYSDGFLKASCKQVRMCVNHITAATF